MKAALLLAAIVAGFAGCAVTGNPREGGLFGWSESMARERVAERREKVAAADAELGRENRRERVERGRLQTARRQETAAVRDRDRSFAALRAREDALSQKAAQLEAESPTPASASRAHRLRSEVAAIRQNSALPLEARARELRRLEVEIDDARGKLSR